MLSKERAIIISVIIILILIIATQYNLINTLDAKLKVKPTIRIEEKQVFIKPKNVLVSLTKETLAKDLAQYKGLSTTAKIRILSSLFKYSNEYKINPLIVYSLIATESSFRFWIKHSLATVTIKNKKVQTRAIGLGAIIYEWWKPKLPFIEVKSDLYDIDKNIHATYVVLSECIRMPQLKGSNSQIESGLIRYFGGGMKNKWYATKVNNILSRILKQELYYENKDN